jgi:hypothetical protein
MISRTWHLLLGLSSASANLRNQKIHTEGSVLVIQEALELCDLLSEHVWGVTNATDHTDAASVGDSCCELRASSNIHASEHDRVCDLEQVGGHRADLFYVVSASCLHWILLQSGLRGEVMFALCVMRLWIWIWRGLSLFECVRSRVWRYGEQRVYGPGLVVS